MKPSNCRLRLLVLTDGADYGSGSGETPITVARKCQKAFVTVDAVVVSADSLSTPVTADDVQCHQLLNFRYSGARL